MTKMLKIPYKESVKTVTYSFNSISTSLNYISNKKKYFMYNSNIGLWIYRAQEIIKKNSKFMLESEVDFLKAFVSVFRKSQIHDIYRVNPQDYLEVFNKGLMALESRIHDERNKITRQKGDIEFNSRIQLLFKIVYEIFKQTREDITENFHTFLHSPNKVIPLIRKLHDVSTNLIKTYYFEFLYLENSSEVSIEELEQFQFDLMDDWYNNFVEGKDNNPPLILSAS